MNEASLNFWVSSLRDAVWSPPLLLLIFITGVYLTLKLKALPLRYALFGIKQAFSLGKKVDHRAEGDISHFQALMTSLASAIGTGSVVGVATALETGGMGSIFWMWVTALIGMSLKYAESLLAVKYRIRDSKGEMAGGPMYYIANGLKWRRAARLFALFGAIAAIGTGNMVQVNSIAATAQDLLGLSPWLVGALVAMITWFVLMKGVLSISRVASFLVPFMALFYFLAALYILFQSGSRIGEAFQAIFVGAFSPQAAAGGFLGATVAQAIQVGVARSIFSSEAGLGVSSIAAAAAKTDMPARQGMVAMTGALPLQLSSAP
ncbi:MAG: dagA [Chlamydiales bacterium]|nr:dagA [Chlamydiales bacterium]